MKSLSHFPHEIKTRYPAVPKQHNLIDNYTNEDSLIRFIHSQADKYNQKFMTRIHKGFGLVTNELLDRFSK